MATPVSVKKMKKKTRDPPTYVWDVHGTLDQWCAASSRTSGSKEHLPLAPEVNKEAREVQRGTSALTFHGATCSLCATEFQTREEQRNHFQSDWHVHNVRAKAGGQPTLSADAFNAIAGDDEGSVSGGGIVAREEDEWWKEAGPHEEQRTNASTKRKKSKRLPRPASPRCHFTNDAEKTVAVWRVLLDTASPEPDRLAQLADLSQGTVWTVLLCKGNHFAGAIFDGGVPVVHKTFQRYIVRAKAGGRQSTKDNQGGNAPKSAGSSIRRYNEVQMNTDIRELLHTWKEHIERSSVVVLHAPGAAGVAFYRSKHEKAKQGTFTFDRRDPRIVCPPFVVRRPTYKETRRVLDVMATVREVRPGQGLDRGLSSSESYSEEHSSSESDTEGSAGVQTCPPVPSPKESEPPLARARSEAEEDALAAAAFYCRIGKVQELHEVLDGKPWCLPGTVDSEAPTLREEGAEDTGTIGLLLRARPVMGLGAARACGLLIYGAEACECMIAPSSRRLTEAEADQLVHAPLEDGYTLLHVAAEAGHGAVITSLLQRGANPTRADAHMRVPYFVASGKSARNAFRRFRGEHEDLWDWEAARVPDGLTKEVEEGRRRKKSEKARRKKQRQRERRVTSE